MRHRLGHRGPAADAGFTLVEVLVSVSIASIMLGIAVTGIRTYGAASRHKGAAREVVATLRDTQVRAVAEARTYCVRFTDGGRAYRVHRFDCDTGALVSGPHETQAGTSFGNVVFTRPDGTVSADAYFYARGSASGGSLEIRRGGSSKVYTVTVEGLTARVSSNE